MPTVKIDAYPFRLRCPVKSTKIQLIAISKWRYLIAGLLLALAVFARLRFNGLIYNFDFGLYFPDGAHYTYRALTFTGHTSLQAAEITSNWYSIHGVKQKSIDPIYLIPETNPVWHLVSPRIVFPLLSAPFVFVFGVPGMLVIPIFSLAIVVFLIIRFAEKNQKGNLGLFLVVMLLSSSSVLRWMISNCTDSLLAALFGLVFVVLIRDSISSNLYPKLSLFILLTTYTRFSLPIWFGISVYIWLVLRNKALSFTTLMLSSAASIPLLYLQFTSTASSESSTSILQLPFGYAKVAVVEIGQLLLLDRPLAFILLMAIFFASKSFRYPVSKLFFFVAFGVWTIGAMNPVAGVNFRYQLALILPAIFVIISNLREVGKIQYPN